MGTYNSRGLDGVAQIIEQHNPDIIGVQEINVYGYPTGPVDQPRWLAERLGLHAVFGPVRQFPEQVIRGQTGLTGNALLSRFPIQTVVVHELPKLADLPYRTTLLGGRLQIPTGSLTILVTHWAVDLVTHSPQARATIQFAESWRDSSPTILMGDFNALPDSAAVAMIRQTFTDAWECVGVPAEQRVSYPSGPRGSTTPDGWAGTVDYIFTTSELTVETVEVMYDRSQASDHNPVVARLRWETATAGRA